MYLIWRWSHDWRLVGITTLAEWPGRHSVVLRIPSKVEPGRAAIARRDDAAAVGVTAAFTVIVRTADIDDVGKRRPECANNVVIPALTGAVVDALPGRKLRYRQIEKQRHSGLDPVAPEYVRLICCTLARVAAARIHSGNARREKRETAEIDNVEPA